MKTIGVVLLAVSAAAVAIAQSPPRGPRGGGSVIESTPPVAKNEAEKKALDVLDDMDKNQRRGSMSVPMDDGRLLRALVESMGAKTVVELGTSMGIRRRGCVSACARPAAT